MSRPLAKLDATRKGSHLEGELRPTGRGCKLQLGPRFARLSVLDHKPTIELVDPQGERSVTCREILEALPRWFGILRERGVRFLTVKTVAASPDDLIYGATRKLYDALGFLPVEVFPTLSFALNPRLMMIKPLD